MLRALTSSSGAPQTTRPWCPTSRSRPRRAMPAQHMRLRHYTCPCMTGAAASQEPTCSTTTATQRVSWQAPCGTRFEVLQCLASGNASSNSSSKPPLVFVHGLFRAAWCWNEGFMSWFSAQEGYDCYAISLRGQGGSELAPGVDGSAAQQSKQHSRRQGVPLATNVADIAAFVATLPRAPVLVGHSLGGYFVQEYLAQLSQPNSQLPTIAGAALLASATAGKVMAFGEFVADVGLREFCWQMYIVASSGHLKDIAIARDLWWTADMPQHDAQRYFDAVRSSSHILPYQTSEVSAWHPTPPQDHSTLPPVLAIGGKKDRVIRPFQVVAAQQHWGAEVVVLEGACHDLMLGPKWRDAADALASWLNRHQQRLSTAAH